MNKMQLIDTDPVTQLAGMRSRCAATLHELGEQIRDRSAIVLQHGEVYPSGLNAWDAAFMAAVRSMKELCAALFNMGDGESPGERMNHADPVLAAYYWEWACLLRDRFKTSEPEHGSGPSVELVRGLDTGDRLIALAIRLQSSSADQAANDKPEQEPPVPCWYRSVLLALKDLSSWDTKSQKAVHHARKGRVIDKAIAISSGDGGDDCPPRDKHALSAFWKWAKDKGFVRVESQNATITGAGVDWAAKSWE